MHSLEECSLFSIYCTLKQEILSQHYPFLFVLFLNRSSKNNVEHECFSMIHEEKIISFPVFCTITTYILFFNHVTFIYIENWRTETFSNDYLSKPRPIIEQHQTMRNSIVIPWNVSLEKRKKLLPCHGILRILRVGP